MTVHGTYAGYQKHRRTGLPLCEPCRRARNDHERRYRLARGERHDPPRCRGCGSVFPDHGCQAPDPGRRSW